MKALLVGVLAGWILLVQYVVKSVLAEVRSYGMPVWRGGEGDVRSAAPQAGPSPSTTRRKAPRS